MKPNVITSCQSKKAYKTRKEADSTAVYLATKFISVISYKCNWCENFHLTSGDKRDK
jgi:hypothetical protein